MKFLPHFLFLLLLICGHAGMSSSFQQPSITNLPANASSQLFSNTSSTSVSNFSYIIPYGQTQDCNIYGPICQTGSITVRVNLTTATTTTILPCSSYLSAQSTYLANKNNPNEGGFYNDGWFEIPWLTEWGINFGRSPECKSYAQALTQGRYTFSGCRSSNWVVIQTAGDEPSLLPPGISRYFSPLKGKCCGDCSVDIPEVRLYYFPDKATNCHQNRTSNTTSILPGRKLEKRIHSLVADGSTAVVSGYTFTSPSVYLQLAGTLAVADQCTTFGPNLTNPIITLPPNRLSTWKPPANRYPDYDNFSVGAIWEDPTDDPLVAIAEGIAPLQIKDLNCPTWGLGRSKSADGTVITTIGPPWLPLIIPPMEMFSLDSKWSSVCTGLLSDQLLLTTFALFDPPSALTPASVLLPTPLALPTPAPAPTPADLTTIREWATPSSKAAKPASLPADPVAPPAKTEDPGKDMPTQSPVTASAHPGSMPENLTTSSKNKGDPPSDPPSNAKVPSVPAGAGDPPAESVEPSSGNALDPPSGDSQKLPSNSKEPIIMPLPGENTQTLTKGLGAIIYNAFGKHGPDADGVETAVHTMSFPPQMIFAAGAITFTANPMGFRVNNEAVSPGGAARIVDGTRISLDSSGLLAIGSSTITLTSPSATRVLAVAGQTFTPNPSAFSIADTIVSADGPAATIDGTTISLDQSGALAIGSTTISLTNPPSAPVAAKAFTVGGQTFTPNPSAFSIAGTTISADGPAVTISGTVISLGQSGALAIGSSTFDLPTQSQIPSNKAYIVAGQIFTANPSAFSIAGTTISAGGSAVTINGTIISLETSGTLVMRSSTVPLLTPQTTISSDLNIDGFDVKVESSFVVVDGVTLHAGAAGVTVSRKVVSLEASGATLDIGTGRFALPTPTGSSGINGSINVQAFTDGQAKGLGLSIPLLYGICVVFYGTLMLLI